MNRSLKFLVTAMAVLICLSIGDLAHAQIPEWARKQQQLDLQVQTVSDQRFDPSRFQVVEVNETPLEFVPERGNSVSRHIRSANPTRPSQDLGRHTGNRYHRNGSIAGASTEPTNEPVNFGPTTNPGYRSNSNDAIHYRSVGNSSVPSVMPHSTQRPVASNHFEQVGHESGQRHRTTSPHHLGGSSIPACSLPPSQAYEHGHFYVPANQAPRVPASPTFLHPMNTSQITKRAFAYGDFGANSYRQMSKQSSGLTTTWSW